jgi:hypothetical protein
MTDFVEHAPGTATNRTSIHWVVAAVLAVVALMGGVWLGQVAFVTLEEPAPLVVPIEVLDTDLNVSGEVEYLPEAEVYILSVFTMPPAPEGSVYQAWLQVDDIIVPAGIMNSNSSRLAYAAYDGRYDTMFVTREQGPLGSRQPTSAPLLTADLTQVQVQATEAVE